MPDWDDTESRQRDEDAAWRDLVARFDAPLTREQPVPWPAREDVPPGPRAAPETGDTTAADAKHRGPGADAQDGEPGRHAAGGDHGRHAAGADRGASGKWRLDGLRDEPGGRHGKLGADRARGADGPSGPEGEPAARTAQGADGVRETDGTPAEEVPEVIQVPRLIRGPVIRGAPVGESRAEDEERFVPPAPPPLPRLDPITKGAWAALFGGPGYLVLATAAGWSVSGLAAFCAVAAFVAGFAILVLRMHDSSPGGPDDGDDGAVV